MTARLPALDRVSYRLKDAAEATGVSIDVLRKAIHATGTDSAAFPPPLKAKRSGSDKKFVYVIPVAELTRWVDSLPDA